MSNPSKALAAYYAIAVIALVVTIVTAIAFVNVITSATGLVGDPSLQVGTHHTVNPQKTVDGTVLQGSGL